MTASNLSYLWTSVAALCFLLSHRMLPFGPSSPTRELQFKNQREPGLGNERELSQPHSSGSLTASLSLTFTCLCCEMPSEENVKRSLHDFGTLLQLRISKEYAYLQVWDKINETITVCKTPKAINPSSGGMQNTAVWVWGICIVRASVLECQCLTPHAIQYNKNEAYFLSNVLGLTQQIYLRVDGVKCAETIR